MGGRGRAGREGAGKRASEREEGGWGGEHEAQGQGVREGEKGERGWGVGGGGKSE